MKRFVSVVLVLVTVLAGLSSCASPLSLGSSSSSAGDSYRAWLEGRGVDTSDVILGKIGRAHV